jgi:hypothetical protein
MKIVFEPGKALVYVIDGTWLGAARSKTYISFSVAPGKHHGTVQLVRSPSESVLESAIAIRAVVEAQIVCKSQC